MIEKVDYFDVDAISNSRLNLIDPDMGGSPRIFEAGFDPDGERKRSKALEMGSAAHLMILEPHLFHPADFERPSDMMITWAEGVAKMGDALLDSNILKAKELLGVYSNMKNEEKLLAKFRAEGGEDYFDFLLESEGKIVLKGEDFVALSNAATSITNHPKSQDFMDGDHELEIYFDFMQQKCKAKLDIVKFLPGENKIKITDLKSTSQNPRYAQGFIRKYRVYRQLGFYGRAAEAYAKEVYDMDNPEIEYNVILVGLKGQHETIICPIDIRWIQKGRQEIALLMQRVKLAQAQGYEFSKEELENDYLLPVLMPEDG